MQINPSQILWQIVNFAILLFILTKFLYRPILKILEERSKKIHAGLEAAEKSLEDRALAEQKHKQTLIAAEKEAAQILDQARVEAKEAAKDIIAAAKKDARESVEKEYRLLQDRMKQEELKLRRNIAQLVVHTTEAVLAGSLTDKAQRQIIHQQIKQLAQVKH